MHAAIKNALGVLLCCCTAALLFGLCELVSIEHQVKPGIAATASSLVTWFDCRTNRACLTSQVLATVGSIKAASAQSYQASRQMEATAAEALGFTKELRHDTHAVLVEAQGTLKAATTLLGTMNTRVDALLKDADQAVKDGDQTLKTANETLKPLKTAFGNIAQLTATLNQQIAQAAPEAAATKAKLDRAFDDLDHLLADPNIGKTIAHIEGTSKHLESSADSIDIAMKPWRERAHLLKTVVSKAWDTFLHLIPLVR